MPKVELGLSSDARRHPLISDSRIEQFSPRVLSDALESTARKAALLSPIPHFAQRVALKLNEKQLQILRGEVSENSKNIEEVSPYLSEELSVSNSKESVSPDVEILVNQTKEHLLEYNENLASVIAHFRDSFKVNAFTIKTVDELAFTIKAAEGYTNYYFEALDKIYELERQVEDLKDEFQSEILDHAETELESLENINAYLLDQISTFSNEVSSPTDLRQSLKALSHVNLSAIGKIPSNNEISPSDFIEMLGFLDLLDYIEFTGDTADLLELNSNDYGRRASKTWSGLRTLNDYARAKTENAFQGGLFEYLENCPPGFFCGISKSNVALQESEATQNDPRLANLRIFAVPEDIAPDGKAHMFPHLKIGQRLRVHFLDAVASNGKIFVGYIGPHLPTQLFR
jgi:hypothetical protein